MPTSTHLQGLEVQCPGRCGHRPLRTYGNRGRPHGAAPTWRIPDTPSLTRLFAAKNPSVGKLVCARLLPWESLLLEEKVPSEARRMRWSLRESAFSLSTWKTQPPPHQSRLRRASFPSRGSLCDAGRRRAVESRKRRASGGAAQTSRPDGKFRFSAKRKKLRENHWFSLMRLWVLSPHSESTPPEAKMKGKSPWKT